MADNGIIRKIDLFTEIAWWAIHLLPFARYKWMKDAINPETRQMRFPKILLPYIDRMRSDRGTMKAIDVGCGPLPPLWQEVISDK